MAEHRSIVFKDNRYQCFVFFALTIYVIQIQCSSLSMNIIYDFKAQIKQLKRRKWENE